MQLGCQCPFVFDFILRVTFKEGPRHHDLS